MIFQNDRRLNKKINLYGCRFRCLQAIAEAFLDKELEYQDILDSYHHFSTKPQVI